jgi:hypothetical protein
MHWVASQVRRDTMGFPDRTIQLPADADDATIERLCIEHTARLQGWVAARQREETEEVATPTTPTRYDGTVLAASRIYQEHAHSPFQGVKANTRRTYLVSLQLLEQTVGARLIRNVTTVDVKRWYAELRKPATPESRERIDRAHDAISIFKTVLAFHTSLRRAECKLLLEELERVRFEKGGTREEEMTSAHCGAFIRKAIELGQGGILPLARARSMAIGVAAQFELALRQKDVIGEHAKNEADLSRAQRRGATAITWSNGDVWVGTFTWENVPAWRWRMKTSKSKYRQAVDFDLSIYGLLHPLLAAVPLEERRGAIITGESGLPVRERTYRKTFRAIARAAGIPDAVWSMDSRAGAATEAEEAGVPIAAIAELLTHTREGEGTTPRYVRRRSKQIADIAEARARSRASD